MILLPFFVGKIYNVQETQCCFVYIHSINPCHLWIISLKIAPVDTGSCYAHCRFFILYILDLAFSTTGKMLYILENLNERKEICFANTQMQTKQTAFPIKRYFLSFRRNAWSSSRKVVSIKFFFSMTAAASSTVCRAQWAGVGPIPTFL